MDLQLPQWRVIPHRLLDRQWAMQLDSLSSSHPVSVVVDEPNEINQQFDAISYDKGCSVIAMLESYLNHEGNQFREILLGNE